MVKHLLSFAAFAAVALCANAVEPYVLPLTSDDTSNSNAPLYSGWSSSYDQATKTITYDGEWTGRGWWLEDFNATSYSEVVIETEATVIAGQVIVQYDQLVYDDEGNVVIEYGNEKHEESVVGFQVGATKVTIPLNDSYKNKIVQIYIQCAAITATNNTITLVNAQINPASAVVGEESEWQLVGSFNNWDNEGAPHFMIADGKYVLALDELTTGFKVITNGSWDVQLGAPTSEDICEIGKVFQLAANWAPAEGEEGDAYNPQNINFPSEVAKVTNAVVTLDPEAKTILVEGTIVEAEKPDNSIVYVVGNVSGWMEPSAANAEAYKAYTLKQTETEGVYYGGLDFPVDANPMFRIYTALTGWDADSYGSQVADSPLQFEFDEDLVFETAFVKGKGSFEMTNFMPDGVGIYMTVDFNEMTVKFVKSLEAGIAGIEAVEAAPVYFNLQGMRVANPAQGKIYIVVRGDKATKEIVR